MLKKLNHIINTFTIIFLAAAIIVKLIIGKKLKQQ